MKCSVGGSCILITGASSGIGEAFARQLAPVASRLVLIARREDRLKKIAEDLRSKNPLLVVDTISCDLAKRAEVDRLIARLEDDQINVDVLVNNAGMGDVSLFSSASSPKLLQMIDLNVVGLTHLTHRLVPGMIARRRGGILMVGSTAGYQVLPGFGTYSATKFYVRGLAEVLRAELSGYGVAVTHLCPGPVATEFAEVAVGGTEMKLPAFLEISADACARAGIRGLISGKAVVLPGWVSKTQFLFIHIIPVPLKRFAMKLMAKRIG